MAKFGEKVFDFKGISRFFKIPIVCSDDKIFLNLGKNSVVKVFDEKPLHTWTLMHPHTFTSSVIYLRENIYCIMDNNVLIRWSEDEDNLINAKKLQFQDSIFAVIPMEGELLVLFNSGKYATVDTNTYIDFKLFDFTFLKENEKLVWADASGTAKTLDVFCLARNRKSKSSTVYHFTINKEDKAASNLSIKTLSHEKATLKSWCLNHHDSSLLSIWSDGTIYSHNMKDSKDSKLLSFKSIDAKSIVGIENIDSTHIAVASGSWKQKECVLEIWDSKCAVLKARKTLKTASLISIQIAVINYKLFLSHNDELVSFDLHIENPTFAAAVGKSLSECNKILEYSWDNRMELSQVPSIEDPESMEVCDQELNNVDSIESIAHRLLNENSEYLMLYIRELELTKLLQLAIRYKKEETGNENHPKKEIYTILNIVFSAPFNDYILVKYLKMLNSEEVLVALEFLLSYLNHTIKMPSNITERPSDLQVVNWASLIIQTHVEDFLFSKDKTSRKLLKELKKALSVKIEEYEDFECIQNYFSVIEKKDLLPQNCFVGKYCVESLDV